MAKPASASSGLRRTARSPLFEERRHVGKQAEDRDGLDEDQEKKHPGTAVREDGPVSADGRAEIEGRAPRRVAEADEGCGERPSHHGRGDREDAAPADEVGQDPGKGRPGELADDHGDEEAADRDLPARHVDPVA